ncbi:MAG: c-type cytochrome [Nitrospira sp. CG24C]|nr:MAG: c-type cytochrome [Nitrospira sp. CG24C]TKB55660.1 MAG: c-type cytochrome [Nitrospira sp.]
MSAQTMSAGPMEKLTPSFQWRKAMKPRMLPLLVVVVFLTIPSWAAERQRVQLLVPADKLAEARALTSPLPNSPETAAQGKAIYDGKGACFRCHGKDGDGNGPLAARLNPSPRNFQDHGFWSQRTEGEVFWLIKNGSPGTGLVGYGDQLTDGEIWTLIQYLRSFTGEHGPA